MSVKRKPVEPVAEPEAPKDGPSRKARQHGSVEHTRVDEAYVRILSLITEGKLGGGERLPSESELSTLVGVSRPVIRQALTRLQQAGIVKVRWGAGTFVQDTAARATPRDATFGPIRGLDEVKHVYVFRSVVESEAAALAAQNRQPEDIAAAHRALKKLEESLSTSNESKEADLEFHLAIAAASGNPFFVRTLRSIQQSVEFSIGLSRTLSLTHPPERLLVVQDEHVEILNAIEAGDAERAREAMKTHLKNACRRLFQGPGV